MSCITGLGASVSASGSVMWCSGTDSTAGGVAAGERRMAAGDGAVVEGLRSRVDVDVEVNVDVGGPGPDVDDED